MIFADGYAPPGERALWQQAAVCCAETPEAIKALPARLQALADDPARVAVYRQAGQQLWARYGPEGFIGDVQDLLAELGEQRARRRSASTACRAAARAPASAAASTAAGSILAQSWWRLELLLIDDASRDDSLAIAKALEQQDPRVRVIALQTNGGPYVAKNVALGAWDSVRVGADNELLQRLRRFAPESLLSLPQPVMLQLDAAESLTTQAETYCDARGVAPARVAYEQAREAWLSQQTALPQLSFPMVERPFAAPEVMRTDGVGLNPFDQDRGWTLIRHPSRNQQTLLIQLERLSAMTPADWEAALGHPVKIGRYLAQHELRIAEERGQLQRPLVGVLATAQVPPGIP